MQIQLAAILLITNLLPIMIDAQKSLSHPKKKPEGAVGPCLADRTCNNGLICDESDLYCKKKFYVNLDTRKKAKISLMAVSYKKRKRRDNNAYRCSNGLKPSSQCFWDNTCGYSPQYQCNTGPRMNFCCPSTGTGGSTNVNQPSAMNWPGITNVGGIGGVGGCQPNFGIGGGGGGGCLGYGCLGGCQIQPQPQILTQPQPQPQPWVIAQPGCPSTHQDIGQCFFSIGSSCSTSGNGQCFNNRCCEPTNPNPTGTGTITNGCMIYVHQYQKSFDICPGNLKCVNGQCVAEQTTSAPSQPCIPVPCQNVYNQQVCCWGRKKK